MSQPGMSNVRIKRCRTGWQGNNKSSRSAPYISLLRPSSLGTLLSLIITQDGLVWKHLWWLDGEILELVVPVHG